MASAKDLRKRIASVKSTQQITKAMKMISAVKLRRAQESILSLRPYAHELRGVISTIVMQAGLNGFSHPLLTPKSANAEDSGNSLLLIVVTSDRGHCGGFNANAIKAAQQFIKTHGADYGKFEMAFIGKKGFEFFKTRKPGEYHAGFFTGLNFKKSQDFAESLIQRYLSGEYNEIKFIYNEFKSAISQKVNLETLLPIAPQSEEARTEAALTIYEPGPKEILETLLPKHFATQVHRIFLESLAAEHGARMAAMENATKNAGEMIRKITLLYNKTRQVGITKELLEIVSGTEAQKN